MHNEAFREFYSAFTAAESTIEAVETLGGRIEDGESDNSPLLIGLGLVAVAKAIQAQTLGLRLVHAEAAGVRTHG